MPRNRFMLTSHCRLRTLRTLFYFYCEGDRPTGIRREKGYTSPLKTHHHDKHRGEANVAQFVYTMHRVGKVVPPKVIF